MLQRYNLSTIEQSKDTLPIILECFESGSLKELGKLTDLPLVMLIKEYHPEDVMPWLPEVADYAHAIGPRDVLVFHEPLVNLAREHGLAIHPWYVRDDFLEHTDNAFSENMLYFNMKFEGIFSEFPHTTLQTYLNALETARSEHHKLVEDMAKAEKMYSSPHDVEPDEMMLADLDEYDMLDDMDEELIQ